MLANTAFWGDRFDTFGDETFWTDTLRLHEAIALNAPP